MKRFSLLSTCFILLFLALAMYAFIPNTAVLAQTVPTRTPTPGSGGGGGGTEPVNTPSSGGGGGNNPTNTPVPPTAVPTNTPIPATIPPTPVDGTLLPTACGDPLFVASRGPVNVRQGPGTNYALLGQLVFMEGRPIIGRAQNAAWWLILLADEREGWVANSTGTVYGYGTAAPIATPPPINGANPTPGPLFQPTPNSGCAVSPTPPASPTASPTASQTATATATRTRPAVALEMTKSAIDDDASATTKPDSLTETGLQITPRTSTLATETEPTATPPQSPTLSVDNNTAVGANASDTSNNTANNDGRNSSGGFNWFLLGGIGLILLGLIGAGVQAVNRK